MNDEDPVAAVVLRVARALEKAGVEYMVGGSVASSLYGEPRSTQDIDFAVTLDETSLPALIAALGSDFAVDEEMVIDAIHHRRSANIFYLPFFMKVDLFIRAGTEYDQQEFARKATVEPVPGEPLFASSREDNLLWKLRWFRMGGEVSDQQWRDVLGILRLGDASLDLAYLERWSEAHGVSDLLERAISQSRGE